MRDYSQSREQAAILKWARGRTLGRRFLDIGAGNGTTFSNTRALALEGWTGICVEPAPGLLKSLCALYVGSDVTCVGVALTPEESGLANFYYAAGDHLSSLDSSQMERWPDVVFETITVMTCSLGRLLYHFATKLPNFVSIDTEGSSVELLRTYSEHATWKGVECVCVEAEDGEERAEIAHILRDGWKTLATTPNNIVLCR